MILAPYVYEICLIFTTLWGGYSYCYLYVMDEETKAEIVVTYPQGHSAGMWLSRDLNPGRPTFSQAEGNVKAVLVPRWGPNDCV